MTSSDDSQAQQVKTLLDELQKLRTQSEYHQAIGVAHKLLSVEPANEQVHQHLIFCLAASGDPVAALRQYQQCERAIQIAFGTFPMPETTALYQWVKQQIEEEARLAAKITNLPIPPTSFVGRTLQLREIKWMICPAAHRNGQEQARLLTLIGAGGSGKTRLAIQVATDLINSFADGVWWVDLTALNDGAFVARAVAKALGVQSIDDQKLLQTLSTMLSDKQLLLVIDNCEHLLEACGTLLAELLSRAPSVQFLTTSREPLRIAGEICWHVPTLTLPNAAQRSLENGAMLDDLRQAECIQLFVDRAAAVQPGFTLTSENAQSIIEICERLDGIPLAIELAAARVRVLTVQQIAGYIGSAVGARFQLLTENHRTALPRQHTLYATIDWSYNLLNDQERLLFQQVAIFQGGFTFEALQAIADSQVEPTQSAIPHSQSPISNLLDLLTHLIDKSLIIAETEGNQKRYRLLESLREYALGKLAFGDNLVRLQTRHAGYYLQLAEQAAPALQTIEQTVWLDRLAQEYGNVRAALSWFEKAEQVEAGLQLSIALTHFWYVRGYFREGQRWFELFLSLRLDQSILPKIRIDAQIGLASLQLGQGNFATAKSLFEESLTQARQLDYATGIVEAALGVGGILWELSDYELASAAIDEAETLARKIQQWQLWLRAITVRGLIQWSLGNISFAASCFDEALTQARKLNNVRQIANGLFNLAILKTKQGHHEDARQMYEECIALDRQLGNESHIADALINLGQLMIDLGEFSRATIHTQEAARIYKKLGDHADIAYSLYGLAGIAFYRGHYADARLHYQEALELFRATGNKRLIGRVLCGLAWVACRQGELTRATSLCRETLNLCLSIGHRAGVIFVLEEGYAELAAAFGQPALAARLLAVTEALNQEMAVVRAPVKLNELDQVRLRVQAQLGDRAFAAAWEEGRALGFDQAVALAQNIQPPGTQTESEEVLRVFALGPARIYRGNRLLTSADWKYDKARELVVYLLCQPDVTQAEVGMHFWPDATHEQIRRRFGVALTYARTALGRDIEWIVRNDGHYRFNPAQAIWLDIDVFEAKLKAAKLQIEEDPSSKQAIQLLEDGLTLYQGEFVEDIVDGEWQQPRRTTLLHTYVEGLVMLAKLYNMAEQFARAIPLYQLALSKDPYLEEAHVGLMRAFAGSHQRGQALQQYELLVATLADLQASPSPDTLALIEALRRGDPL